MPFQDECLGERHARELGAGVAVLDQPVHGGVTRRGRVATIASAARWSPAVSCSRSRHASRRSPASSSRSPTTRRRTHVLTYVKSATQRRFGAGSVKSRSSRSGALAALQSGSWSARPCPHETADPELTHQPVDLPFRHRQALPSRQRGQLPSPIHRLRRYLTLLAHADGSDRVDDDRVREVAAAGLGAFPRPIGPLGDGHPVLALDPADRPDRAAIGARRGRLPRRRNSPHPGGSRSPREARGSPARGGASARTRSRSPRSRSPPSICA